MTTAIVRLYFCCTKISYELQATEVDVFDEGKRRVVGRKTTFSSLQNAVFFLVKRRDAFSKQEDVFLLLVILAILLCTKMKEVSIIGQL